VLFVCSVFVKLSSSLPVQVIDWKDSSPNLYNVLPGTNPTHSLTQSPQTWIDLPCISIKLLKSAALKDTCLNPLVIRVECQHGRARNLASFDHRLEVRQKIHVFVHVSRQNLTFRAHNKAACKHTAPASSAPGWYLRQKPVGGGK